MERCNTVEKVAIANIACGWLFVGALMIISGTLSIAIETTNLVYLYVLTALTILLYSAGSITFVIWRFFLRDKYYNFTVENNFLKLKIY